MSIAILCHSKDENRNILDEFFNGLTRYAPSSIPIYLTTENVPYSRNERTFGHGVTNILTGDGLWSTRLRKGLESIPEDNILFFLEDMIVKSWNHELFQKVVDFHISNDNDSTKFGNDQYFDASLSDTTIGNFRIMEHTGRLYRLSHQPTTLFKKSFLLETIQEDVTPWDYECLINDKLVAGEFGKRKIFIVGSSPPPIHSPGSKHGEIIEYHHALMRGQRIQYNG